MSSDCNLDCHKLSPDQITSIEDVCVPCLINNSIDHFLDRWESLLLKDTIFNQNVSDVLRNAFRQMLDDGSDVLTLIKEKQPTKYQKLLTILKI
jgi:hypothetical protein|tara:strand:- start:125 stop:406 length:282 start_codon:yes stop_codon:yes gene_type:complete